MAHLDAIDRAKPQKLYHQLIDILRSLIEQGRWKVGAQIPTEEQLCTLYNVSKATVRLAVDELAGLGYLKKFQGKGTFVRRKKPDHSIPLLTNLAENGICNNPSCLTRLVEYPDDRVKSYLQVENGDHCHYLSKLTITADRPFMLQKVYFPYRLVPVALNDSDEELSGDAPPYVTLEKLSGLKIHRIREFVDIVRAGEADALLLAVPSGETVLRSRHVCHAPGGVPVIYSEYLYQTSVQAWTVEFERLTL
jgi:DNA-binding GntR family transcriptional regulator